MEIDTGHIELARSTVNTPIKSQGGSVETDPGDKELARSTANSPTKSGGDSVEIDPGDTELAMRSPTKNREGPMEIDPWDTELARSPVNRQTSNSLGSGSYPRKQIPQERSSPQKIAKEEIRSDKTSQELNRMMEQRLGVEQDDPADEFDENSDAYRNHHLQVLKAIAGCKNLKKLIVWEQLYVEEMEVLCKNLLSHPELEYQHLWKGSIAGSDKEMEFLCNLLENNHIIKTLQLWREGVAVVGAASLGLMLGVNSTLEELDLYGNPLGPDGVEALLVPSYW
jgi:hypothetical protein